MDGRGSLEDQLAAVKVGWEDDESHLCDDMCDMMQLSKDLRDAHTKDVV